MKLQLPGTTFTAWVTVDGAEADIYEPELEENEDDEENGPVAKCWIESKAGKYFSVNWFNNRPVYESYGKVFVDGIDINGQRFEIGPGRNRHASVSAMKVSPREWRGLTFAEFHTTDDDNAPTLPAESSNIGEIKIIISHVKTREFKVSNRQKSEFYNERAELVRQLGANQTLHESSKKAGFHRMQLGRSVKWQGRGSGVEYRFDITYVREVGTFIFRYRPKDMLIAQGSIQRPNSPVEGTPNSSHSADEGTSNIATNESSSQALDNEINTKIADLARRQQEIMAEVAKLQEETESLRSTKRKRIQIKSEPDLPDVKIKRERVMEPTLRKAEVIDLTDL